MFIFPAQLFRPKAVAARPVAQVISGGMSLSGIEDTIATDGGGRWVVEMSDIDLSTPLQQKAWSAWAGYLAGGNVECLVPLLSLAYGPRMQAWNGPARVSRITSDHDIFPTYVRYESPRIVAAIGDAAGIRATTLAVSIVKGGELVGGEKFSIGSYAYRIVRETSPGYYQITPPLREAVAFGDSVDFEWPVVKARLAPGQDMESPIQLGRFSSPTATFLESPPVTVPA